MTWSEFRYLTDKIFIRNVEFVRRTNYKMLILGYFCTKTMACGVQFFFSVLPTRIVHEVPVLLQSTVHSLYVLLITTLRLTIISITKCNKINSFTEISSVSGRSKSNIKMVKLRSYSANLIVRSLVCLYLNGYYGNNLNR